MDLLAQTSLLLSKLNDRTISFPDRCEIAASLLKPSKMVKWSFPRKNQFLFDWLTGSLLKLARSELPNPEIFLNTRVWCLLKDFAQVLEQEQEEEEYIKVGVSSSSSSSLKRSSSQFLTDDDEFFNYKKSFDPRVFVIKCPLLTIFKTSLSLLTTEDIKSEASVDPEVMCSVMLSFFRQNRVSLPVSFLQMTEFIDSLVKYKSCISSNAFLSILKLVLDILSQVILGGTANYKKTYPLLVRFCLQSATKEARELWIDFMKKCLFPSEYLDELLVLLTSPAMISVLNDSSAAAVIQDDSKTFPKTLTFQKTLFISLATENSGSLESGPLVYEAFLQAAGFKINRESGFNFFTFLLRNTLPHAQNSSLIQLSELISVLQSRGNEIYQQRNDQIYRNQSAVIEEIFNSALNSMRRAQVDSFPLLLSLARLNYYMVVDHFVSILSELKISSPEAIDFIVGMFELSALANQLPALLEQVLKSNLSVVIIKDSLLQLSLSNILLNKISPSALNQMYLSLTTESSSKMALTLLLPVVKCITKIIDNVESFDAERFKQLQRNLLSCKEQPEALNLLTFIVRYSPGTFLLIEDLYGIVQQEDSQQINSLDHLNLIFALKCKNPFKVSCKDLQLDTKQNNHLVLKYLPILAEDLSVEFLESFSLWLLGDAALCLKALKMIEFFEIQPLRLPFLEALCKLVVLKEDSMDSSFIVKLIEALPWEYFTGCESVLVRLICGLWKLPEAISSLLQHAPSGIIKSLVKTDVKSFVQFLLSCPKTDLISNCLQVEHSPKLIKEILSCLKSKESVVEQLVFISKMLKFADFDCPDLLSFIETQVNPVSLMKQRRGFLSVEVLDALDVVLEWAVNFKMEFVASCILALPTIEDENVDLRILVRGQALKCKFPARNDIQFILESIDLAGKLAVATSTPASLDVLTTFRKDLLALLIQLPSEIVLEFLKSLLIVSSEESTIWKFSLGLQATCQLLHVTSHVSSTFSLFVDNLQLINEKSMKFDLIPAFLAALKSILQLKKNVSWESGAISIVLGILRRIRQAKPECYEEIYSIYRLILTLHIRSSRHLIPLLVSNLCEGFSDISGLQESSCLSRTITEVSNLRRGEIEPFVLLPLLYTFISMRSSEHKKPLQLAMNNLMFHLSTRKQLLQLLSTALVVDHEQRVILKAFIDEYNKFHRYSGSSTGQINTDMNEEIIELKQKIDELQTVHSSHIKGLEELNEARVNSLQVQVAEWRDKCEALETQKTELDGLVEGMKVEVEVLRQSFDLVQGRLKKVLIHQDDLVRLVQLIEDNNSGGHSGGSTIANSNISNSGSSINSSSKASQSKCKQQHATSSTTDLDELEVQLKATFNQMNTSSHNEAQSSNSDPNIIAMLQSIKYFRKLEASDPVHLCRLLDISFCPDRSFSLSNSLLSSISLHMASEDGVAVKSFKQFPIYSILLNEIVKLRQEINHLSRIILSSSSARLSNQIGKRILDKSEKGTISNWLHETNSQERDESPSFTSSILGNLISKFK